MRNARVPPSRAKGALATALVAVALLGAVLVLFGRDEDDVSPRPVQIRVGETALTVPANHIRFADQRRGGALPRLDLAAFWPGLTGVSPDSRTAFATLGVALPQGQAVLQIAVEPRTVALDSAARLASVYVRFLADEPADATIAPAVDGLVVRRFRADSPYADETLYFEPGAVHPFVARCFPRATGDARRLCLMEVPLGKDLFAAIRFPPALLSDWMTLRVDLHDFLNGLLGQPAG